MGYPPGVRENGGQYTHGSLWLAMAWARMGDGDHAVRLLQIDESDRVQPQSEAAVSRFRGEPYVSAADVSAAPGHDGTLRMDLVHRLGRRGCIASGSRKCWDSSLRGDTLTIEPAMPRDWPGFEMTYRYRSSTYKIRVERGEAAAASAEIKLIDDGETHDVLLRVGDRKAEPVAVESKPLESANGVPKVSEVGGELMPRSESR